MSKSILLIRQKINSSVKHVTNFEDRLLKYIFSTWPFNVSYNEDQYLLNPQVINGDGLVERSPFQESILWAVPKSRRSVEKRRSRRIGAVNYFCKLLPVKKLLTCNTCGNPHEVGILCPFCYEKVMKVTNAIKEAMLNDQGKAPIENDYLPVFKGEKVHSDDGFYEGKRIVEISDERPSWFAKKLTQKSNETSSSSSSQSSPGNPNPFHVKY